MTEDIKAIQAADERKGLLKRSPDIATMVPYWDEVSDILQGYEAVKRASTTYLPMFPDEDQKDYDVRLANTKFTNVYKDVVEGLACKPFENEVSLLKGENGEEIPQELIDFIQNVDGSGNNLSIFSALTFFNGINYAIDWILVDYPTVENGANITQAEAKKLNLKPYWVHILGKNVLEVKTRMDGSKEVITYFRCQEPGYLDEPIRVRIFELVEGKVEWSLHEKTTTKEGEEIFIEIEKGIISLPYIPVVPFVTGRRDGKSFRFYPPMQDTADLQMVLYRNESALEYIKTLACYPMLATDGTNPPMKDDGKTIQKIKVGPNRTLFGVKMENGQGGNWKYVEPNANSLEFLKKDIDKTKQDLRELGRQPLTALSSQLTTVTTSVAAGKAKSAVSVWALSLKDALENALVITLDWMGIKNFDPQVNVYDGFDNILDSDADVEELGKARERGDISRETWWEEMKRRKILSPEFNYKTEIKRLLSEIISDGPDTEDNSNEQDKDKFNQEGNIKHEMET